MKINNFFCLLIFFIINNNSRFGGGGHHFRSGRSHMGGSRNNRPHHNGNNSYSHGSGRNNFNHHNAYGNFGSFGGAAAWGLGGLGMGLLMGGMIASDNNNENITIINPYDNKNENHKDEISNNYDTITKNLKLEIEKIKNLSKTIYNETKNINSDYIPPFIEVNFAPYEKIEIITKNSNELYGDFKKEKVKIVNFKADQEIKIQIESIRNNIEPNLKKLISLTDSNNKNKLEMIKNDLRVALKILNKTLLHTVKKLQE